MMICKKNISSIHIISQQMIDCPPYHSSLEGDGVELFSVDSLTSIKHHINYKFLIYCHHRYFGINIE